MVATDVADDEVAQLEPEHLSVEAKRLVARAGREHQVSEAEFVRDEAAGNHGTLEGRIRLRRAVGELDPDPCGIHEPAHGVHAACLELLRGGLGDIDPSGSKSLPERAEGLAVVDEPSNVGQIIVAGLDHESLRVAVHARRECAVIGPPRDLEPQHLRRKRLPSAKVLDTETEVSELRDLAHALPLCGDPTRRRVR